jgi:sulfhydrogenase subunit alpha
MTHKNERVLSVAELARVEGEGALYVRTVGDRVEEARLDIYEPPRFFEAFLRGRGYTEPPDITARICGICPVAYQMSACAAMEDACGVTVPEPVADLRRLLYCGEWIESHALHIYLLHAPDFLGYRSGIEMAGQRRDLVERGLALKKAGNAIMEAVGGRAIHPVNVRLGGFYRAPARAELTALTEPLKRAMDGALDTVRWVAGFDFPDHACATDDMLALSRPGTYAIERGSLATRSGLTFPAAAFDEHVIEEHVPYSTALHAHLAGGGRYLTGPLARYTLGSQWLSPLAREAARAAGLGDTCDNPFRSIVVRAVETVYAVEEALRLIAAYQPPDPPAVDVPPRAGTGYGVTEAPRGTLYHRYQIDAGGLISTARIVPPTSQNQAAIEADLRDFVQAHLDLDDAELTRRCEQAIRNYDPCISCSTHFLDLTVDRSLFSTERGRFPWQLPVLRPLATARWWW